MKKFIAVLALTSAFQAYAQDYELSLSLGKYNFSNAGNDIESSFKKPANIDLSFGKIFSQDSGELKVYGLIDFANVEKSESILEVSKKLERTIKIFGIGSSYKYGITDDWFIKGGLEVGRYKDKAVKSNSIEGKESDSNSGAVYSAILSTGYDISDSWSLETGYKYSYFSKNKFEDVDFRKSGNIFIGASYRF
nr:outer membrane beta-barrel protein [Vibrio parahaemolyticus]